MGGVPKWEREGFSYYAMAARGTAIPLPGAWRLADSTQVGMAFLAFLDLHFRQAVQDAAVFRIGPRRQAALAQIGQLRLQLGQFGDALVHVGNVLVEQFINCLLYTSRCV